MEKRLRLDLNLGKDVVCINKASPLYPDLFNQKLGTEVEKDDKIFIVRKIKEL